MALFIWGIENFFQQVEKINSPDKIFIMFWKMVQIEHKLVQIEQKIFQIEQKSRIENLFLQIATNFGLQTLTILYIYLPYSINI